MVSRRRTGTDDRQLPKEAGDQPVCSYPAISERPVTPVELFLVLVPD
jgi:hypothetical protein